MAGDYSSRQPGFPMSCDYAVWFPHKRLSHKEAGKLYLRLCEGSVENPPEHPAIEIFYQELTAHHPEIDTIPEDRIGDHDFCPWSVAFDRSPGHLIMCCVWPKADYVGDLLKALARKHGLALYDPQSERVLYADDEPKKKKPWWKLL
jgi:hypothetical protein